MPVKNGTITCFEKNDSIYKRTRFGPRLKCMWESANAKFEVALFLFDYLKFK